MCNKYVFIGAGPANLFTILYGFLNNKFREDDEILLIEKGKDLEDRNPKKDVVNGVAGAGLFSDFKLVFSLQEDQPIFKHIEKDEVIKYFNEIKNMIKQFDKHEINITLPSDLKGYETGELKLKTSECWHIGSTKGFDVCKNILNYLKQHKNFKLQTNTEFKFDEIIDPNTKYFIGVGRAGNKFMKQYYRHNNISLVDNEIHFGVRFECEFNKKIEELAKKQYDFKYFKSFTDNNLKSIRTFCVNHKTAEVITETVQSITPDKIRLQANGHAYGMDIKDKITNKTNFAILGEFVNINPNEFLTQIERISHNVILTYNETNSEDFIKKMNIFYGFGDKLIEFIFELKNILEFDKYNFYFPEIKIIGAKTDFNNDFSIKNSFKNVHIVGDCGFCRGIVPSIVTGLKTLDSI